MFLAGALAPAAHRYAPIFRLGGLPATAAFLILPLYIGPALLWLRPPLRWWTLSWHSRWNDQDLQRGCHRDHTPSSTVPTGTVLGSHCSRRRSSC